MDIDKLAVEIIRQGKSEEPSKGDSKRKRRLVNSSTTPEIDQTEAPLLDPEIRKEISREHTAAKTSKSRRKA